MACQLDVMMISFHGVRIRRIKWRTSTCTVSIVCGKSWLMSMEVIIILYVYRISDCKSFVILVCHAEMNAILNKIVGELKGCRIYVAMFPCNECAKLIIQSGIKEVNAFSIHFFCCIAIFISFPETGSTITFIFALNRLSTSQPKTGKNRNVWLQDECLMLPKLNIRMLIIN